MQFINRIEKICRNETKSRDSVSSDLRSSAPVEQGPNPRRSLDLSGSSVTNNPRASLDERERPTRVAKKASGSNLERRESKAIMSSTGDEKSTLTGSSKHIRHASLDHNPATGDSPSSAARFNHQSNPKENTSPKAVPQLRASRDAFKSSHAIRPGPGSLPGSPPTQTNLGPTSSSRPRVSPPAPLRRAVSPEELIQSDKAGSNAMITFFSLRGKQHHAGTTLAPEPSPLEKSTSSPSPGRGLTDSTSSNGSNSLNNSNQSVSINNSQNPSSPPASGSNPTSPKVDLKNWVGNQKFVLSTTLAPSSTADEPDRKPKSSAKLSPRPLSPIQIQPPKLQSKLEKPLEAPMESFTITDRKKSAAHRILRFYRAYRCRKLVAKCISRTKHRRQLVRELWTTEETYVTCLTELNNNFIKPIKEREILSLDLIEEIFPIVCSILDFHVVLLAMLRERMQELSPGIKVGDIFLRLIPFMKIYSNFVNKFDNSNQKIHQFWTTKKKFRSFVKKIQSTSGMGGGLTYLTTLMGVPFQRIPRYQLLLGEILKDTPAEHPDFEALTQAYEKVREAANHVNTAKRQREEGSTHEWAAKKAY